MFENFETKPARFRHKKTVAGVKDEVVLSTFEQT
jgi:hypothetical protein